jgi:UDP-3-O-[3-hydroxymyristoyl] N-acetylglucosamine deacetylase
MHTYQRTIKLPVYCSGIGLHSGKEVKLEIHPAPVNHGIKFIRTDLPDSPSISARFNMVVDASQATVIGYNGFIVSTIEHLMASFSGMAIDNALVRLNAYEVPFMDGSAGPFTDLIKSAGIKDQEAPRYYFKVEKPIELKKDGKAVSIIPADDFKLTCHIEFAHPLIMRQSMEFCIADDAFKKDICRARSFGFFKDYELMKFYGLSKGVSLENLVVLNDDGVMNEDGLRFKDEFVRHKILDCLGDFSLLGLPLLGHISVHKSGHAFNHAFLNTFFKSKHAWSTKTLIDPASTFSSTDPHSKALAI